MLTSIVVVPLSDVPRFAKYREVREALHNFEGVLLGCLVIAFEELSPHLLFAPEVLLSTCMWWCFQQCAVSYGVGFNAFRRRECWNAVFTRACSFVCFSSY